MGLIKIHLIAFKTQISGLVSTDMTIDFALDLEIFFIPISFCIHISMGDLAKGLGEAADGASETHSDAEQEAVAEESNNKMDSEGNANKKPAAPTPAPAPEPEFPAQMEP